MDRDAFHAFLDHVESRAYELGYEHGRRDATPGEQFAAGWEAASQAMGAALCGALCVAPGELGPSGAPRLACSAEFTRSVREVLRPSRRGVGCRDA